MLYLDINVDMSFQYLVITQTAPLCVSNFENLRNHLTLLSLTMYYNNNMVTAYIDSNFLCYCVHMYLLMYMYMYMYVYIGQSCKWLQIYSFLVILLTTCMYSVYWTQRFAKVYKMMIINVNTIISLFFLCSHAIYNCLRTMSKDWLLIE